MLKSSVLLLIALSTLNSLGVGLLGPVYPIFVVNRFSASFVDIGLLYAVFCLVAALFKIPAGKLVDVHGEERVLFIGVMVGAACSLAYIVTSNLIQLYIIEFFFGISYALQRPSLLTLVSNLGGKERKGLFLGMFESFYDVAEAMAAVLSTIIASKVGFEPLFLLCSGFQATTGFFVLKISK
jgi:MFS family permease